MRSQLYSLLKFIIGLPLTLVALFFIIKTIVSQAPLLVTNIHTVHIFLLGYGIICFIIFYFLRAYIWFQILKDYHDRLTFKESTYLWALSNIKRYIPGNIWAFLSATLLFEKKGIQKKEMGKSFIIEAELFVIGSAVISLLSLPFYFSKGQYFLEIIIPIIIFGTVLLYCFNKSIGWFSQKKVQKLFSYLLPPFTFLENLQLVWSSVVALFFFGLGNYFVISSVVFLNPRLFLDLIGVFDLAFVVGYLTVVTPAGFGVREGVVIFSLTKIISSGLAAFSALFSRIVLIISEVIFIGLSTLWYRTHFPYIERLEKMVKNYPQITLLTILSIIYVLYFTIVSFLRYDNFYTGRFDLGNMAQTVWNSLHGRIFLFTNPNGTQEVSRLAFHADFILVLLAPFYTIWENPKMLLLIQTLVVTAGAYFVYIIARDILKNRNVALVFSFAYLINPSVQRANIFDFHAVTLATTFVLATYYFFMKKRYAPFIIFAILAALCKEQIWLIIALFGILVFFMHKKRVLGSVLFLFSVGMFYFLFWYAIPKTLGSQHFALAYLSDFGDSPTQVIKEIILSPNKVFETFLQPSRLDYLNQLFLPIGYLFIFFPFFLIFAGPDLLINMLSNNTQLHQIYYQYTATITPFIFLSAIYGVYWLRKITFFPRKITQSQWNIFIIIYLLIFSLFGAYSAGPLPGSRDPNLDMFTKQVPDRVFIDNFLSTIPKKDTVAASNDIGSHLSLRENIYEIPYGLDSADVIVLLLNGTDPEAKDAYKKVSKDPHYHEIVHKDGFVAFAKK